jgi:hypothetical protein
LLSPMAFEERCQKTTFRHVAHSKLAPASWLASPHGFLNQNEHEGAPPWPSPLWLLSVPKDENTEKGMKLEWHHGNLTWTASIASQHYETAVSQIMHVTGKALGHVQTKKGATLKGTILICNWYTPKIVILPSLEMFVSHRTCVT